MNKCVLLIALSFSYFVTEAQKLTGGVLTGLGTYQMEELKHSNELYVNSLPFEVETVDKFPSWMYYKFSIGYGWKRLETGLVYSFYSSGARYAAEDYSGKYQFDNKIRAEGPGIWFSFCFNSDNRLRILGTSEFTLLGTTLTMDETLALDDISVLDESYKFKSRDLILEPGIKLHYPFSVLIAEFSMNYALQANGKGLLLQESDDDAYLQVSGTNVHTGWNGFRFGVGLILNFSMIDNNNKRDD